MAVTLSTGGHFVSGTTSVNMGRVNVLTSGTATTYSLPKPAQASDIPVGYFFYLQFTDGAAQAATIAAQSGETVSGDTGSTLANEVFMVVRNTTTSWYSKSLSLDAVV